MKTGALKSCLEDAWRPTAPWNLVPIGKGYFDIHFNKEDDMRRAWGGGTCTLATGLFRLSKWTPDFKPGDVLPQTHAQVWIKIFGLSQEYWHPRHLMEIARGVGTPLQLDSATRERQYGYYARILVDVNLADDLPTSLMVERESHGFPMSRGRSRSRTRKGGNMGDNKTGDHSRSIEAADDGNAEPILQSPLGITPTVSGNVIPETDTADTHISIQSPGISHISNSMTESLSPDGSHPQNGLSYGQHLGNTIVPNNLGPHDLCDDSSTPPGFEQVETVAQSSQQLGNTDVPNNFGMQDPHDNHSIPPGFEHVATLAKDVIDIVNHIEGCDMDGFTPVLFWNIRGIGNDDSRMKLSNICRLHHPNLVCIAEPMVTVRCTFDHIPSQFTFVYASTSPIKRRDLWADFISLRPQTQVPWMAIGDFNAILGAHE
ncbi:hypothetical protein COP2_039916 [Malus domestica]